jgi:hypothetical protein
MSDPLNDLKIRYISKKFHASNEKIFVKGDSTLSRTIDRSVPELLRKLDSYS